MPAPKKHLTEEDRKKANRDARLRWEAKNPDKIQAKRDRENQRKRKDRATRRKVKVVVTTRVCLECGIEKDLEEYGKHGKFGRVKVCLTCNAPEPKAPKERKVKRVIEKPRKAHDYDALELKVNGPKDRAGYKRRHEDWVVIVGDIYGGGIVVKHRDGILLFARPDGVVRYGVMGDDSGGTWIRLDKAEKVRDKLWAC